MTIFLYGIGDLVTYQLSDNYIKKLSKIVDGLNTEWDCFTSECLVCTQGKQSSNPFHGTRTRTKRPLHLVHMDECGPIVPTSRSGKCYYVFFIDDFTHFAIVYPIREKFDTFNKLKKFEAIATAYFGTRMSKLRWDNGGEYICKALKEFCEWKGIQIQYTSPYTPQKNGHAERLIRTIYVKKIELYSLKAISRKKHGTKQTDSAHLLNRSYTTTFNNVTPAEMWFGSRPDIRTCSYLNAKLTSLNTTTLEINLMKNLNCLHW